MTIYRDKVEASLTVDGVKVDAIGKPGQSFINGIKYLYFGGYFTTVKKDKINVSAIYNNKGWVGENIS